MRPADTAEVARSWPACAEAGRAVVPQGGNTGLVGGERAARRGRWSCCRRAGSTALGPVDAGALQVTAGAGVTLARWREHARAAGLDAPVDFASRDSATIGGAIATNAGGSRVVRFGTMRAQVAGLTAVLADGSAIGSLAGLPKETVGVHWPSLLAGSEGTLGVVTAARLRLVPWYRHTATAMVATASLDDAVAVLAALRADVPHLDAVELILPEAMARRRRPPRRRRRRSAPARRGAYVVVECADHDDPTDELTAALADRPEVLDAAVTTEGPARDRLVAFRDRITESISAPGRAAQARRRRAGRRARRADGAGARASIAAHGGRLVPFGHLAEGNVHVNVLDAGDPEAITAEVLTAPPPGSAARSRPSTASASPRPGGCTSCARRPSWPRRPPSSTPSTRPASSTPASSHPSTERRPSTRRRARVRTRRRP